MICDAVVPQANTLRPYLNAIRGTLDAALCLRNFPSQTVERHNKPEVETRYDTDAATFESLFELLCIVLSIQEGFSGCGPFYPPNGGNTWGGE